MFRKSRGWNWSVFSTVQCMLYILVFATQLPLGLLVALDFRQAFNLAFPWLRSAGQSLKEHIYKRNSIVQKLAKTWIYLYLCMYWTNFWQPTIHAPQNIWEKTVIEVGSPQLYASFGTFCAQIGQLFEAQWVLEVYLKISK